MRRSDVEHSISPAFSTLGRSDCQKLANSKDITWSPAACEKPGFPSSGAQRSHQPEKTKPGEKVMGPTREPNFAQSFEVGDYQETV